MSIYFNIHVFHFSTTSSANFIDIDLANGDETAANEKYAAIVNHDIQTMKKFLSQGRYDYLTLLNRVNTAFGKIATGRHSKKDRIRQGKALMQLARGEDLKSMGVTVAFPEDVIAGLKRGDSHAIEKAIRIFNDAGIHSVPFARYAKSLQTQETAEPSRERRSNCSVVPQIS